MARHEASDTHKANVHRKIREASEGQKKADVAAEDIKAQLKLITEAAEAAIAGKSLTASHPLDPRFEVAIERPQSESIWSTCRTEDGRMFYANKITGATQWNKPVELGGITETASLPSSINTAAPPRPKSSAPPPRPKAVAAPPRPKPGAQTVGDSKLLASAMLPTEESNGHVDHTTGFGEWEVVSPKKATSGEHSHHEDEGNVATLPVRESKRFDFTGKSDDVSSFNRTITKRAKRRTREEDSD